MTTALYICGMANENYFNDISGAHLLEIFLTKKSKSGTYFQETQTNGIAHVFPEILDVLKGLKKCV